MKGVLLCCCHSPFPPSGALEVKPSAARGRGQAEVQPGSPSPSRLGRAPGRAARLPGGLLPPCAGEGSHCWHPNSLFFFLPFFECSPFASVPFELLLGADLCSDCQRGTWFPRPALAAVLAPL